jgi:hypothetical protein
MFNTLAKEINKREENRGPAKQYRMNAYSFEAKMRGSIGNWQTGRVFALNGFQAMSLLSARGDVAEVYYLKRLRGDWSTVHKQSVQFDSEFKTE